MLFGLIAAAAPILLHMFRKRTARESYWGRKQTVTDYVAGLTDSYAVQLFNEIFMPPVGLMVH